VTTTLPLDTEDDNMPAEIDFSEGVRGKFFCVGTRVKLPVDPDTAKDIETTDDPR
jgi:hypothetical protein